MVCLRTLQVGHPQWVFLFCFFFFFLPFRTCCCSDHMFNFCVANSVFVASFLLMFLLRMHHVRGWYQSMDSYAPSPNPRITAPHNGLFETSLDRAASAQPNVTCCSQTLFQGFSVPYCATSPLSSSFRSSHSHTHSLTLTFSHSRSSIFLSISFLSQSS